MNNKEIIDNIPIELLPAMRKFLLETLSTGQLKANAYNNIKETIKYIEQKMNENNIDLNTYVSNSDIQKAQKYMGGYSGVKFDNNFEKEYDDGDIWAKLCGIAIGLYLLYCLIVWIGSVLTNLWNQGIIQIILIALGVGGTSYGIYKLWENGFFDKIKRYFDNKTVKNNTSKRNAKVKTYSKSNYKNTKSNKKSTVKILATATVLALLGTGYKILDKNVYNGKKVSLFKYGRVTEKQNHPYYDFNDLLILGKKCDASGILNKDDSVFFEEDSKYFIKPSYYRLNKDALKKMCKDSMDSARMYMSNREFNGEEKYYHFDRELYFYQYGFSTEMLNLFTEYRNALIYYASKNNYEEFKNVYNLFLVDCSKFVMNDYVYQVGSPLVQGSYRFSDLSNIDRYVILSLCNAILDISNTEGMNYCVRYIENDQTFYVSADDLKRNVLSKMHNIDDIESYVLTKHCYFYD